MALPVSYACDVRNYQAEYRHIVIVEDAVHGGYNLFDLDHLRMEYSSDEYQNLQICKLIDDPA